MSHTQKVNFSISAERLAFLLGPSPSFVVKIPLHPFREGNGRTIRIFLHAYAINRGIEWAYETLESETYIQVMIQSVTDLEALRELFLETIQYVG